MPKPKRHLPDGMPYLVSPDELQSLGVDPDAYFRSGSNKRGTSWAGWMLDRKKDAALIARLQSKCAPHGTLQ